MSERKDITTIEDIRLLVDTFYGKVRLDPTIGAIFIGVIKDKWPEHLSKMYRFWQTILLGEHTYTGNPFPPHSQMPIEQKHFDAWLRMWHETVDEFFAGEKADEAKWRGVRMAEVFLAKISFLRDKPGMSLV